MHKLHMDRYITDGGDVYGSTLPMPYDKFNDFVVDNLFDRTGRIYYGNFGNGTHYRFLIMVPFADEKETELDWSQAKVFVMPME